MKPSRSKKIALAFAAALLAIPAAALLVVINFDWNRAKPWLNERVSAALDRPFAIRGDLALSWEKRVGAAADGGTWRAMVPWPNLVAHDIHIGNPTNDAPTGPATELASIRRFDFSVDPLALLGKTITVPVLRFEKPIINLQRAADGRNNWTFAAEEHASPWKVTLQRVVLSEGSVHLDDKFRRADLVAQIDTINADPDYGVQWQLRGKINGDSVEGSGKAGAVLSLQHQTTPYPLKVDLRIGNTTVIHAEGTLTKPSELAALDMRLQVSGASMARLYAVLRVLLPETPPFVTDGHLTGVLSTHGSHWTYENFSGKVGSSDIAGTLDYKSKQARQPRPLVSGTVVSRQLNFSDLSPMIGADSNVSKRRRGVAAVQPPNKVLPVETFKTDRWTSVDADIDYSAEKIIRKKHLPINKLHSSLHLQDGVLSLSPLEFDMAGGSLSAHIVLDGSGKSGKDAINATMTVTARHLKLKQLLPSVKTLQTSQASVGEINGDASLSAVGDSVASLFAASNGEIKTLINQGTVSKLLLEEMGLNIGSVIVTRLLGDKQVKLNCMAADFGVTNGLMQTRSFIIDTDQAILQVNGSIDLTRELLDLTILPRSKGLRVFSLRAPLYLRGSFQHPRASIDKGVIAMRAVGALALAALAPIAAMIPLINAGPGENSACAKLLADARVLPRAPPPGKTWHAKPVRKSAAK